jgi:hypothetical protein
MVLSHGLIPSIYLVMLAPFENFPFMSSSSSIDPILFLSTFFSGTSISQILQWNRTKNVYIIMKGESLGLLTQ